MRGTELILLLSLVLGTPTGCAKFFRGEKMELPEVEKIKEFPEHDFLVWLGHSSFLIKLDGFVFYTDPVLSERVVVIKRLIPFPVEKELLPPPHFVLISHNHYDHMDIPSLVFLSQKASKNGVNAVFFTPEGASGPLKKRGIYSVELGWGKSFSFEKNGKKLVIKAVKVKHFSGRGITDYKRSKWNGYLIEGSLKIFFAGDTAFTDVGKLSPRIALMPIGAWRPRWFMRRAHVSPCEAVRMAKLMNAEIMIPMHFGTFRLGLDTPEESLRQMEECASSYGVRTLTLRVGEILPLKRVEKIK